MGRLAELSGAGWLGYERWRGRTEALDWVVDVVPRVVVDVLVDVVPGEDDVVSVVVAPGEDVVPVGAVEVAVELVPRGVVALLEVVVAGPAGVVGGAIAELDESLGDVVVRVRRLAPWLGDAGGDCPPPGSPVAGAD